VSLRLRLLLVIAAVNVGVLLLVVGLGTATAGSKEQVSARALREAFELAESPELANENLSPAIRFVVRYRPHNEKMEGTWAEEAVPEVERWRDELLRLLEEGEARLDYDRDGVTRVNPSPKAEWSAWRVGFTSLAHQEALEGLQQTFILLSAGTILLIGGTYLILRVLVLRPLEQLAQASRAVAEGKSPPSVPRPRGNDEVATLVDDFNRMAAEVHEYQMHLEDRVLDALGRASAAEGRLVVAQRLAATGTLAAGFAHEINNPLGGVLNALRKLREGNLPPAKHEEYFELAFDGLERIRTIVERILHFTPRQAEPTDVDVAEACSRAVGLALHRAERRGVRLELDCPEPVRGIVGDPQELTQALLNLILNAIDAFPEGRGGTVHVSARREGREAVAEVADDGVGMDPETARRCVDLFFSTKPEGEGTGLGLAIVQHIVTDHGGSMEIQSREGEGTRVILRLPIQGA